MRILEPTYIFSGTSNSTLLVCKCMFPLLQSGGFTTAHHHSQTTEVAGAGLWSLKSSSSSQPCWSWFDSGQQEECVQGSPPHGGLRSVLTPKGQNQHSKPQTQPLLQMENYTNLRSPFQLCFLLAFGASASPPSL